MDRRRTRSRRAVALVTGASSGIGQACAEELARAGLVVFGTSRRPRRIDVLVNNAGIALEGALEETAIGEFKDVVETNLFGTVRMMQAVLPIMRKQRGGRIVNMDR